MRAGLCGDWKATMRRATRADRCTILPAASSWRSRQLPRYAADFRIKIALPDTPPRMLHARTSDLSTGGVCIVLPEVAAEGSIALIGLRASTKVAEPELTIWFRARLRHRSGFRCGYQFLDLSAEQRLFLRQLCRTLPK